MAGRWISVDAEAHVHAKAFQDIREESFQAIAETKVRNMNHYLIVNEEEIY